MMVSFRFFRKFAMSKSCTFSVCILEYFRILRDDSRRAAGIDRIEVRPPGRKGGMMTAIITVIGKDHKGIIASVSNYMSENEINILDISQTIMQEYFTMIMLVDLTEAGVEIKAMRESLDTLGENLKVEISLMHQDLFDAMHRI